ncbi:MAG: adenylyl-sulfate kinase [Candidatus Omnitrophica bacterium]|nr:adenylyl-sulfate kinase [Candidatus Omnitrophota bacterium]
MVLWIIGMSGSGKTALGKRVYEELKPGYPNLVFLDGDILREIMGDDLGHTIEDRKKNAGRITRLCKYLDSSGINVIFAVLSLFHESQRWMRENIRDYYEVYIESDLGVLVQRDSKGIYKKAINGEIKNVVGVDIAFPPPLGPDLTIKNDRGLDDLYREGGKIIKSIKPLLRR